MGNEGIWVKRSSGIFAMGIPLIVMCAGEREKNHWWGEYHVLVSGRHPAFYSHRCSFDGSGVPQEIATVDLLYMRGELEQQVQGQISSHCFDVFEQSKNEFYLQSFELADGEKADLLRLWLRGEFHTEIEKILRETQCEELRAFLSEVTRLPSIIRS
jgi:hypothetical protein